MRYVIAGAKWNIMDLYEKYNFHNFLLTQLDRNGISQFLPMMKDWDSLIVDSWAFSVWTRWISLDFDEYGRYAVELNKEWGKKVQLYYVWVDCIPWKVGVKPTKEEREESAKKSYENWKYMNEKYKVNWLPVFHQHEDFKWLMKYVNEWADYIGISPANDLKPKERLNWLGKVFYKYLLPSWKKVKTHWFWITTYSVIKEIPFYSCDSTSWLAGAIYNAFFKFDKGKSSTFTADTYRKKVWVDYSKLSDYGKYEMNLREIAKMIDYVNRLQKAKNLFYYE